LIFNATYSERELFPKIHDEFTHLVQAQILAKGRLWLPPHPLADFFDSYFIAVRPVYAATSFPGASLLYVPGVWLGVPHWITAVFIAGLVVASFYLVTTALIDGVAGVLAALLLLSLQQFRLSAMLTMSYVPMALAVLLVIGCYVGWRRVIGAKGGAEGSRGSYAGHLWSVALGVAAGWAAITRPGDAACMVLPLALVALWELERVRPRKRAAGLLMAAVVGAAPFVSLQLIFDKGVAGHALLPPIERYNRENFPGNRMAYAPFPEELAESPSPRAQVRDFYDEFIREPVVWYARAPIAKAYATERWAPTANESLPGRLMWVLLPLGVVGLCRKWNGADVTQGRDPRAALVAVVVGGVVLLPALYTFRALWVRFYTVPSAPAFILLALLGVEAVRRRFPAVGAALFLAVATLAIGALPELRAAKEKLIDVRSLLNINQSLASLPHTPAVVLFKYVPKTIDESGRDVYHSDVFQEPVYNVDSASPDDAEIVRANDLGDRNREIFEYYAGREPQRFFYSYDRSRLGSLTPLGWAKDLARAGR
jgi:4-amino-4-deoxy-L-arabinose transferase-like glycosyltransferase